MLGKVQDVRRLYFGLLATACAFIGIAALASAAHAAPAWYLESATNSTVAPGGSVTFALQVTNVGSEETSGPYELEVDLPAGIEATGLFTFAGTSFPTFPDPAFDDCSAAISLDPQHFTCTSSGAAPVIVRGINHAVMTATVDPLATETSYVAEFTLSGGGAPDSHVDRHALLVTNDAPEFGFDAFDGEIVDPDGTPLTQAGATPYDMSTTVEFTTRTHNGQGLPPIPLPGIKDFYPVEPAKDVVVDLPAGLVGDPTSFGTCTLLELTGSFETAGHPYCPIEAQVGTVTAFMQIGGSGQVAGPTAVYSVKTTPDVPARFGFNIDGQVVLFDAKVRSGGDHGLSIDFRNISQGLPIRGSTVNIWGVPADPVHDVQRTCPFFGDAALGIPTPPAKTVADGPEAYCPYERPPLTSFLRTPTSCTGALETTAHIASWQNPGRRNNDTTPDLSDPDWKVRSFTSHEGPGYPFPESEWGDEIAATGCDQVPFNPQVNVETTSSEADSPTGLAVDISVPQTSDPNVLGSSDLKDATVTLPEGFSLNPSAADGLESCTLEEIDLDGQNTEPKCPNASKIGTTTIDTPLLDDPLTGAVYQAEQNDPNQPGAENPFDSLVAYYIVAEGPGTVIKLPGKVDLDEDTGQIVNTFEDNPQLPFNSFHVEFFDGPRSPIATPPTCTSGELEAELTPWARPDDPVTRSESLAITSAPNGKPCVSDPADRPFSPVMNAGVTEPVAGGYSPFVFQLTREDGEQEILSTTVNPPQGLTAKLAGIPYCSEADIAASSCGEESRIGTEVAGAGVGSSPFYTSADPGAVYLAGPYKGAPLSMVISDPVVAGPFDLQNINVRAAIHVDPRTAQLTVISDEIPQIVDGIPLRIRDLRIRMDRPEFTIAPTNCDPLQVGATVQGSHGAVANLTNRFQVGDCANLGFNPKLKLDFGKPKKNTKRNAHPPLRARLAFNEGDANISSVQVALPQGVRLDQDRIGKVCSREAYAAESCPEASQVGYAKATTPLLDQPVEGPVYLKASDNVLPDLAADLNGQIDIDLFGKIDQKVNKKGDNQIRNTFDVVPDVPVGSFELTLEGGADGLLWNGRNLCSAKVNQRVSIDMAAHNEMSTSSKSLIGSACKKINKKKAKKLRKKAKRLLRKAKRADSKKKSKKLRKKAKRLKRQARKLRA